MGTEVQVEAAFKKCLWNKSETVNPSGRWPNLLADESQIISV